VAVLWIRIILVTWIHFGNPDPHPHPDPHSDPHRIKIRIRIPISIKMIEVKSGSASRSTTLAHWLVVYLSALLVVYLSALLVRGAGR
jgi:hypothetical protein